MLHDMSKEFWHGAGVTMLVGGLVWLIAGWYFDFGGFTALGFMGCLVGASYALQLGNAAESRSEREKGGGA
jgi:hypothetical protein